MSTTVDNRVVEMQFNNSQFESNVKTSLNTIEKLKESLKFSGVADSFDSITSSAEKVDVSTLGSAVENVRVKFSALEVIAVTALANITNSAISAGKQLISSLSVDNIADGWEKFANKTQSVGTLISQGYDLDTVTDQLERLNWYTDETSYNFTDMVANIAKFTASGQDLETSVTAMEGIANWAALSGQNATTASQAMYQLAQAMSAGYMRLEDYKSIQNASMDTAEFRQKCIDAAVALGTLQDNADGTYTSIVDGATSSTFSLSSFTTSLTEGCWLTSDVMMDVFNNYSSAVDQIYEYAEEKGITASEAIEELGDSVDDFGLKAFKAAQEARTWGDVVDSVKDAVSTGWMNTFEIIFGNYEEATALWTDLANAMYDVFAAGAEDRNNMLEIWKELGGRTVLIDTFWTAWNNVGEVLGTVKEAFREVFPSTTAGQLYSLTKNLQTLVEKFKMSDEALNNLKSTFKGVFAVLDIVKQGFLALVNGIGTLFGVASNLGGGILSLTGFIGELVFSIDEAIKESDIFNVVVQAVAVFIRDAIQAVIDFAAAIKEWLNLPDLSTLTESAKEFINTVTEKFVTPGIDLFEAALSTIGEVISDVISSIFGLKDATTSTFDSIDNTVSNCTFVKVLGAIWTAITTVATAIKDLLGDAISGFVSALGNADFDTFFSALNTLLTSGILLNVTKLLSNFSSGLGDLADFLDDLKSGAVDVLNNLGDVLKDWSTNIKADTIVKIAAAVGVLAVSLVALSGVDSEKMSTALGAITGLFVDLVAAMTALQKLTGTSSNSITGAIAGFIDSFSSAKQASNMISMAAAIGILAVSLAALASVDQDNLGTSFAAITGLITELVASMIALNKLGGKVSGATTMIAMASSIYILTSAVKKIAELDIVSLTSSVAAIGVLIAEMVAAFKLLSTNKETFVVGGTSMIAFSAAIEILAIACKTLGSLGLTSLAASVTAIGVLTAEMVAAFKLLATNKETFVVGGTSMIAFSAAIEILALACKTLAALGLASLASSVAAIGVLTAEMVAAFKLLSTNKETFVVGGVSMIAFAAAIEVLATACKTLSNLGLSSLVSSVAAIGALIAEMVVAFKLLATINSTSMTSFAAAMLVMAAAINVLTPALKTLGNMSIASIAKALITLAGAFTIIGATATVLAPLTTTIIALSAAFALIGVSVAAIGVGLVAAGAGIASIAVGITSLAASLAVSLTAIVSGIKTIILAIVSLIPDILVAIGEGIIGICDVIAEGATSIANAAKAIILALVDVFVECVPELASGMLEMFLGVVNALTDYAPQIVEALMQLIISIIEAVAANIPELVSAVMDLIGSLFGAIIDAINGLDSSALINGIECVGLLSALVVALSAISSLIPSAMVALAELGVLVAEMSLIFAAIGALAQIPGLTWLINEGAGLLESVGNAIGSFIGGIVGGFMSGVSSQFPQIGSDLSAFMENVQPFIEGASKIDSSVASGVEALAETILVLTAADILSGLTSWLTGGSSLSSFGEELAEFGPYFSDYYDSVKNIDGGVVEASANAASALAEMANNLPNSGGVVSWFTGDNSLSAFAEELAEFGPSLKAYADSVDGLDADVVTNSANAALTLAEMAEKLPNSGGVVGWFTGDNSLSAFAKELASFGPELKNYADSVSGLDADVVTNSANAALALAEMASNLPNQNGIVSWFTGDNNLSTFGVELAKFGPYLAEYAESISGVNSDVVVSSANAASALAEMATNLPEQGGIISWFTGDNTLSAFGAELERFGPKLKAYSDSINGLNADLVTNSANAAKALFEMAENLPEQGGIVSWFTGGNTLSAFAEELEEFGPKLKAYSDSVEGVSSSVVTNSANAAKALFEMAENLPDQGGIVSWFTGGNTLSAFGEEMAIFGPYLAEYAASVAGISSDVVVSSANAASALAEFANNLPEAGGLVSLFTGETDIAAFGEKLVSFGHSFAEYAASVSGIDTGNLSSVVAEFKKLAEFATSLSSADGTTMTNFAQGLTDLGNSGIEAFISAFENSGSRVTAAATTMINAFVNGAKAQQSSITSVFTTLLQTALNAITGKQASFQTAGSTIMTKFIAGVKSQDSTAKSTFTTILSGCLTKIKDKYSEFNSAGQECMTKLIAGVKSKSSSLKSAFTTGLSSAVSSIKDYYDDFYSAGAYLVKGFAAGIDENTYLATAKAKAMASAAASAAAAELDENSPSKVGYQIGDYFGIAFVNAIADNTADAYSAATEMASSAKTGLTSAISKIADAVNGELDLSPTIRPVLDLTALEEGTSTLDALFSRTQAQSVSAVMDSNSSSEIQNGENSVAQGNTYQFTQNNYSPKSLSRSEIYRQTKNQFSALERMVEI